MVDRPQPELKHPEGTQWAYPLSQLMPGQWYWLRTPIASMYVKIQQSYVGPPSEPRFQQHGAYQVLMEDGSLSQPFSFTNWTITPGTEFFPCKNPLCASSSGGKRRQTKKKSRARKSAKKSKKTRKY